MVQFYIVDAHPNLGTTTRERELETAAMRSHIAASSHRARKARQFKFREAQALGCRSTGPAQSAYGVLFPRRRSSTPSPRHFPKSRPPDEPEDDPPTDTEEQQLSRSQRRQITKLLHIGEPTWWASDDFHYVAEANIPFHEPVHKIFNVKIIMAEYYFELLRRDRLSYAAVAYGEIVLDKVRRPGQNHSKTVLKSLNKALHGLRSNLSQKSDLDEDSMLAVMAIALNARISKDIEAIKIHISTLMAILQACGGINALGADSLCRVMLLQWESAWSLSSNNNFLFPDAWKPYNLYAPVRPELHKSLADLPIGFRRLEDKLSAPTLEVLVRTARVASSGTLLDLPHTEQRQRDFWEACPCLSTEDDPLVNLERLTVQALILYCFRTFPKVRTVSLLFTRMQTSLGASIANQIPESEDEEAILIWCWMCLIDSWTNAREELVPTGENLFAQMRRAFPNIDKTEELFSVMRLFFTNDRFERRCQMYWDRAGPAENPMGTSRAKIDAAQENR